MQISRLFQMLYILLSRERVSAAQLARELEVSVRTIYRDAQTLCEAGVPLYAERGRDGGLSILPTYKLNTSMLSDQEKQSILDSLNALAQTGAQDQQALHKLSAFFGTPARDWVQIDFADWSGTQDQTLAALKEAILSEHVVSFDYYSEGGEMQSRQVCPFKLWFKGQAWYLRAFCLSRHAVRVFKLSRLKRAQLTPDSFPPEAYAAAKDDVPTTDWPEPEYIHLILRADACMAYRIYDDFDESSISRQDGGSFLIDTQFPLGAWIKSIVLGYGEHAEVLKPEALRQEILETLQKMAARYKS